MHRSAYSCICGILKATKRAGITVKNMQAFRVGLLLALPIVVLLLLASSSSTSAAQQNDWRVGNLVGLSMGTQIREGPGLNYCYHTTVPEDDWVVKVIGGPRYADGRTWYDTSRREAGDPSGGTGWVNVEQANSLGNPAPSDGGAPCDTIGFPTVTPSVPDGGFQVPEFLIEITIWWNNQPGWVRIGVLIVAILLLPVTRRLDAFGQEIITGLARAILWGIILAATADLTRALWLNVWHSVAGGRSGVDPALVLLILPLAWWAFGLLSHAASRVMALVGLVITVLLLLYLIAPDRLNNLLQLLRR